MGNDYKSIPWDRDFAVSTYKNLREEAAICRDLAREINDPASIAMFLDRARQLEARAKTVEAAMQRGEPSSERIAVRKRTVGA